MCFYCHRDNSNASVVLSKDFGSSAAKRVLTAHFRNLNLQRARDIFFRKPSALLIYRQTCA